MAEEREISSISGKKETFSSLAGGYKAFKEILEIYFLFLTWQKIHGIPLGEVEITTDNGSEFIALFTRKKSLVFLWGRGFGSRHSPIPIRKPEWNGCVENFHGRIEAEFYEVESFRQGIYF
jgi:hypothetical protein